MHFVVTTINGGTPVRVLHAIASGVLGRDAYQGGVPAAALGLGLHFLIAIGAATVYLLASRQLPVLLRRPVICGLTFGLAVWVFMYYVVLPITFGGPIRFRRCRSWSISSPFTPLASAFRSRSLPLGPPYGRFEVHRQHDEVRNVLRGFVSFALGVVSASRSPSTNWIPPTISFTRSGIM